MDNFPEYASVIENLNMEYDELDSKYNSLDSKYNSLFSGIVNSMFDKVMETDTIPFESSRMYNIFDREQTLDQLVDVIKKIKSVVGLIHVGSGARGYKDEYSDIDLVLVVDEQKNVKTTNSILLEKIKKNHVNAQIKIYHHHEEVVVSCVFLENYLELDLGIWTLTTC